MRRPSPPQKSTTFTAGPPAPNYDSFARRAAKFSRVHLDGRNRHDELPAPLANVSILLNDFILQVPRQDEKIIGLRFLDALRPKDRNVRAGQKPAVLVRIAVHRVVNKIGADTAIIQQGVSFSRSAVTGDGFPLALGLDQKREQRALRRSHLLGKIFVTFHVPESSRLLARPKLVHARSRRLRSVLGVAAINPQRAAVRREFFHIENPQTMSRENLLRSNQRKIRKMLMVDGIKLIFLHQAQQVRKFQSNYSPLSQQNLHAGHKTIDVGHLREHVVAEQQIRAFSLRRQFSGKLASEKLH